MAIKINIFICIPKIYALLITIPVNNKTMDTIKLDVVTKYLVSTFFTIDITKSGTKITIDAVMERLRNARGTVLLTICIELPSTNFLNLTSEKSD